MSRGLCRITGCFLSGSVVVLLFSSFHLSVLLPRLSVTYSRLVLKLRDDVLICKSLNLSIYAAFINLWF